jgi:hypothetical protein
LQRWLRRCTAADLADDARSGAQQGLRSGARERQRAGCRVAPLAGAAAAQPDRSSEAAARAALARAGGLWLIRVNGMFFWNVCSGACAPKEPN